MSFSKLNVLLFGIVLTLSCLNAEPGEITANQFKDKSSKTGSSRSYAFQPLKPIQPPELDNPIHAKNDLDRFILKRLNGLGIIQNSFASSSTLIRRAFLDLTGMPPGRNELAMFDDLASDRKWSELIDHLLVSDHYGERSARYWMDIARFAESSGFEHDTDRPLAYHYRDFLIQAFNMDMPWDRMVRLQIAGDELAPDEPLARSATGFLAAGVFPTQLTEAEFEQARYDELDDMVQTIGVAFLGFSFGCARCHDHKFDPVTSRDYYRLASAFVTTVKSEQRVNVHSDVFQKSFLQWETKRLKLMKAVETANDDQLESVNKKLAAHDKSKPAEGKLPALICSDGVKPLSHHADGRGYPHFYPHVYFLKRGDVDQKGDAVSPGYPNALKQNGKEESHWVTKISENSGIPGRRAALSRWLTDANNGAGQLLARVIVNRIWQQHFGTGLVATPNNFGNQGALPTHPHLLDWLANDLIDHGWKLKRLHKLIMTSSVYRLSSNAGNPSGHSLDPENNHHWRFSPRRLEAEAIRDSMLAVSGLLDRQMYGPGSLNENMRRRSIYYTIKRSGLIPMMQVFDWPEHLGSIGKRTSTTTAPQALSLMNGPLVEYCADAIAKKYGPENSESLPHAITVVWLRILNRKPVDIELQASADFIIRRAETGIDKEQPLLSAFTEFCRALLSSNEFLYLP